LKERKDRKRGRIKRKMARAFLRVGKGVSSQAVLHKRLELGKRRRRLFQSSLREKESRPSGIGKQVIRQDQRRREWVRAHWRFFFKGQKRDGGKT